MLANAGNWATNCNVHHSSALSPSLERSGHPLGQNVHEADRWIVATAVHLGLHVISDDNAFDDVTGLAIAW